MVYVPVLYNLLYNTLIYFMLSFVHLSPLPQLALSCFFLLMGSH